MLFLCPQPQRLHGGVHVVLNFHYSHFKLQITQTNWIEFLCDFLEMVDKPELSGHVATIKRGHYGLLDPQVKLVIFRELVAESLTTDAVREQLDEYIEQQRELGVSKREELRRKREEQQQQPRAEESEAAVRPEAAVVQNGKGKSSLSEVHRKLNQNGLSANGFHILENGYRIPQLNHLLSSLLTLTNLTISSLLQIQGAKGEQLDEVP